MRSFRFVGLMVIAGLFVFSSWQGKAIAGGAVSAADLTAFLGTTEDDLLDFGNGPAFNGSGLTTTFSGVAGQVLTFDMNFLTNEDPMAGPLDQVNDYAFLTLTGSTPTMLADVASSLFTFSSTIFDYETGFRSFSLTLAGTGTFTLGIGVVNLLDDQFNSGLLVDNFSLDGSPVPNGGFEDGSFTGFQTIGDVRLATAGFGSGPADGQFNAVLTTAVPEPSSYLLLGFGMLGAVGVRRYRRNRQD